MPNRHFRHGESMHQRERRKEPVHAGKHLESIDDRSAKQLERTAGVMNTVAGHGTSYRIRHSGRNFPYQAVVPIGPPSADEIIVLGMGKQDADVGWIVLEIAVHRGDQSAGRPLESGVEPRRLSIVTIEMPHGHGGVLGGQTVQEFAAAVAASVVHINDFKGGGVRFLPGLQDL